MNVEPIPLHLITLPPEMHRRALDPARLAELADSIRDLGLLNPITVEREGDHFVLRAGHRRLEAHRLLRRETISANVRAAGALAHGEVLTWAENLARADLSQIEEAEAVQRQMQRTGCTAAQLARQLHRSTDWVQERIELLAAPAELQDLVHRRELPMSHARELARVTDAQHRHHLTHYAIQSGASFPVIRDWVAQWRLHAESGNATQAPLPPMPIDGGRIVVLMPCMTCGDALPAEQLRIVRMCPGCLDTVTKATAEWREAAHQQPAQQDEGAPALRAPAGEPPAQS